MIVNNFGAIVVDMKDEIERARCLEQRLNAYQARDFTTSMEGAASLLHEAHAAYTERDRTLVLTAPGGRLLAYIKGDRAWFTTPIKIPIEREPEVEIEVHVEGDEGGHRDG